MYKVKIITTILSLYLVNFAQAESTLNLNDMETMGKVSCMNFIYSVTKIHDLKTKKNNKTEPLFKNAELSKQISNDFNKTVIENKKNKKSTSDSLNSMLSVYNKLTEPIAKADKTFSQNCESYYTTAFKECQSTLGNDKTYESCIRESLNKRKSELASLQKRILSL